MSRASSAMWHLLFGGVLTSFVHALHVGSLNRSLIGTFVLLCGLLQLVFVTSREFSAFVSLFVLLFVVSMTFGEGSYSGLAIKSSSASSTLGLGYRGHFFVVSLFTEALIVFTFDASVSGNLAVCLSTLIYGPLVVLSLSFGTIDGVVNV